jgi:hypothetical protein
VAFVPACVNPRPVLRRGRVQPNYGAQTRRRRWQRLASRAFRGLLKLTAQVPGRRSGRRTWPMVQPPARFGGCRQRGDSTAIGAQGGVASCTRPLDCAQALPLRQLAPARGGGTHWNCLVLDRASEPCSSKCPPAPCGPCAWAHGGPWALGPAGRLRWTTAVLGWSRHLRR